MNLNKALKATLIVYIITIIAFSNLSAGYFLKTRIKANHEIKNIYRIAIIDVAFDLSQFNKKQIIYPYNAENKTRAIEKIPMFDYSGNLKFNNHGTSIIDLFIGKNGLLKNAEIIPIQISDPLKLEEALAYAISQKADVVSISLSFAPNYKPLPFKLKNALLNTSEQTPILIAAGNEGVLLEETAYGKSMISLVKQSNNKIYLVGSLSLTLFGETISSFSNRTKEKNIMLYAPGENICLKNWLRQIFSIGISGTSIATPLLIIKIIYLAEKQKISISQALKNNLITSHN